MSWIVRSHNRLNGLRFSTLEFGLVGLVVLGLAGYFLPAGASLLGVASIGIAVNCLPVVWLGIGSLRAGESTSASGRCSSPRPGSRRCASTQRGNATTYILAGATLLPFLVTVAVVVELFAKRGRTTDPRP